MMLATDVAISSGQRRQDLQRHKIGRARKTAHFMMVVRHTLSPVMTLARSSEPIQWSFFAMRRRTSSLDGSFEHDVAARVGLVIPRFEATPVSKARKTAYTLYASCQAHQLPPAGLGVELTDIMDWHK